LAWCSPEAALVQITEQMTRADGVIDGKPAEQNETRSRDHTSSGPNVILFSVRKSGILVRCNNNPVIRWTGDNNRCPPFAHVGAKSDQLFVGAHQRLVPNNKTGFDAAGVGVEAILVGKHDSVPLPPRPASSVRRETHRAVDL